MNLEAHGLMQQKTTLGSLKFSLKLDTRRLENTAWSDES